MIVVIACFPVHSFKVRNYFQQFVFTYVCQLRYHSNTLTMCYDVEILCMFRLTEAVVNAEQIPPGFPGSSIITPLTSLWLFVWIYGLLGDNLTISPERDWTFLFSIRGALSERCLDQLSRVCLCHATPSLRNDSKPE